jgi:hypothetical protein
MFMTGRSTKILLNLPVCAALLLAPSLVHADTLFTNFGAGNSYNTALGNPVGNGLDGSGFNYAEGATFVSSKTATLSSLMIALSCAVCPAGGSLTVKLTNNSGQQPGSVLESFSVLGSTLGPLGVDNAPLTLTSLLHPTLTLGTEYWVTVSGPGTSAVTWNFNSTGDASAEAISLDGGASWFSPSGLTPGAYAVIGTAAVSAVPEPGSIWLLTTAILGLGIIQFRRTRNTNSQRF